MTAPTSGSVDERVLRAAARLAVEAAELQGKEPNARAKRIVSTGSGKTSSRLAAARKPPATDTDAD